MDRLKLTSAAVRNQFFVSLLPVVQEVLDVFMDFQKEGLGGSQRGIKGVAAEIRKLVREIIPWIKLTLQLYRDIGGVTGALKILAIVIAAVAGAKGLMALTKASNGAALANVRLALSAAAAAAPYVLLALAVGSVLLALDDLRGWIEGEDSLLGEVFGDYDAETLKGIQAALIGIGLILALILSGTVGVFAVLALLGAALYVFWDDLSAIFEGFFDDTLKMWNKWVEGLNWDKWVERLRDDWADLTRDMGKLWDDFIALVMAGLDKITSPIATLTDSLNSVTGGVGGTALRGIIGGPALQAYDAAVSMQGAMAAPSSGANIQQQNAITIPINAANMSPEQLRGAVSDGVDDGLLRTINAGYEGGEI